MHLRNTGTIVSLLLAGGDAFRQFFAPDQGLFIF